METMSTPFTISRSFNAPRELVFEMFSDCKHLKHWWGPKNFGIGHCSVDFRPGGVFLYSMVPPNADPIWGRFVYGDIVRPEKITFINSFADESGGVIRNPWIATWPLEVENTLTFVEEDGKTTVHLSGSPINASDDEVKTFVENRPSMQGGFKGTFDELEAYLATLTGGNE